MKNTQTTDQPTKKIYKIAQHALFPRGSSLIEVPDMSHFLHVSHDDKGQLILHILENPDGEMQYRKVISVPSVDQFKLEIFGNTFRPIKPIGASTDRTRTTYLVFLDTKRYDRNGEPLPFFAELGP